MSCAFFPLGEAGRWVVWSGWKTKSQGLILARPLTSSVTLVHNSPLGSILRPGLPLKIYLFIAVWFLPELTFTAFALNVMLLVFMKGYYPLPPKKSNYSNSDYPNNMNYFTSNISKNRYIRPWRWYLFSLYKFPHEKILIEFNWRKFAFCSSNLSQQFYVNTFHIFPATKTPKASLSFLFLFKL